MDVDAREVLAAVLARQGGAQVALAQLGTLPGAQYEPGRPGGRFRRGRPSRLVLGDHMYSPADGVGTRLQVSHVVRGVVLQTRTLGPAEAAQSLAAELRVLADAGGRDLAEAVEAALYGLAAALGPDTWN